MRAPTLPCSWTVAALILSCAPGAHLDGAPPAAAPSAAQASAAPAGGVEAAAASQGPEVILERPDLAAYHGWIRYLGFRAERADERYGAGSERARQDHDELAAWTQRILANPRLLS